MLLTISVIWVKVEPGVHWRIQYLLVSDSSATVEAITATPRGAGRGKHLILLRASTISIFYLEICRRMPNISDDLWQYLVRGISRGEIFQNMRNIWGSIFENIAANNGSGLVGSRCRKLEQGEMGLWGRRAHERGRRLVGKRGTATCGQHLLGGIACTGSGREARMMRDWGVKVSGNNRESGFPVRCKIWDDCQAAGG